MKPAGVYSLKMERLSAERQQSIIRILLSVTSSLILLKFYYGQAAAEYQESIGFSQVIAIVVLFNVYAIAVWALLKWKPNLFRATTAISSIVEIILITYLVRATAGSGVPFYLWYIFYVASVSTRYGWQYSILALSASIVSFTTVVCLTPYSYVVNTPGVPGFIPNSPAEQVLLHPYAVNASAVLGFTGFLLVLAFMFGQISEKTACISGEPFGGQRVSGGVG